MNKHLPVVFAAFLIVPWATVSADDVTSVQQQPLYDKIERMLVTVEYKAEMTFMGQSDDIEGRVLGLSVKPRGTIIFDGSSLGVGTHFGSDAMGAPRVDKPKSLRITDYRGNTCDAEFIGVDQFSSIAFCRLPDSATANLDVADFSKVDLSLGEAVFIFWLLPKEYKPRFQMAQTVITGIISEPETYYLTGELNADFVMAPVVTPGGDLIGVVTPISRDEDRGGPFDMGNAFGPPVGFMPVDKMERLLAKPPAPGEFKRGWMGISLQALDPEVAEFWNVTVPGGIIVSDVIPMSPAEKAGLTRGDFIVAVDSKPIEVKDDASLTVFQKAISDLGEGGRMNLTVLRPRDTGVDTLALTVALGETPVSANDAPRYDDKNFDLTLRELVFADYNSRDLDQDEIKGMVVDKLESGGWAAVDGVGPGDIIMKINGRDVASVNDCRDVFAGIEKERKREAVFLIWRDNKTQFINVKTHWE